jgi:hypothetical protein
MQLFDRRAIDAAIFTQKFDPKMRFIRFLQSSVDLGTEFGIGSSSGCFARVRRD